MSYSVKLAAKAREDIQHLYAYMLERDTQAAVRAYDAIERAMTALADFPFSCRRASEDNPFLREMVIPFGSTGYVALFEIDNSETITILAVRHQREDDYH